jgi:hypothetical protein
LQKLGKNILILRCAPADAFAQRARWVEEVIEQQTRNSRRRTMPTAFDSLRLRHPLLNHAGLRQRIEQLLRSDRPRHRRLWDYYRNPLTPHSSIATGHRPYRQAQEWGLPSRITGRSSTDSVTRKEVVIENDIAWRVDTMVDWLFGQPITIRSLATSPQRREQIEAIERHILSSNGGIGFLQKLALLGAVHGFVDVVVKLNVNDSPLNEVNPIATTTSTACHEQWLGQAPSADTNNRSADHAHRSPNPLDPVFSVDVARDNQLRQIASRVRFEIVEPDRGFAIPCTLDPARAVGFVQLLDDPTSDSVPVQRSFIQRLLGTNIPNDNTLHLPAANDIAYEVISAHAWQRYRGESLEDSGPLALGVLPLVHIQNVALPFTYAGASDVEPLMPLQDELNTRLSDRAYRLSMQSFKMYLGVGIDDFVDQPVGPGRLWQTFNENARIVEFGGDSAAPSEDRHIEEMREALDKTSGVSPVAAGAVRGRIGRLTSAAALRVTMQALMSRTQRKRTTYGPAIARLIELSLAWLDAAGLFHTTPDERRIHIDWPHPVPADTARAISDLDPTAR